MKAYIKIENNLTVGNPVLEQNLLDVFGSIPENYAPFIRKHPREFNLTHTNFQKIMCEYILCEDGITWTDNYYISDMSEEEKQQTIQKAKNIRPPGNPNLYEFNEQELKWVLKPIIGNDPNNPQPI